jgi:pantetheine-phosphate adenylyltransferase
MTRIAIYPGSFDPPTRGHEDLIRRALGLADRVVVAVAINSAKQPLFPLADRLALLRTVIGVDPRVEVTSFEGLLADYARKSGAAVVVRGSAPPGDFEVRAPDGAHEPASSIQRSRPCSWRRPPT